mgnify:CR=1 FL=1
MPEDMDALHKNQHSSEKQKDEQKLSEKDENIESRLKEKSKFAIDEAEKKQTHPANESKDSMNFGGLIAL